MSIVKWSPLKELEDMRRDMDRLFEEFVIPGTRRRRTWPTAHEGGPIVPCIEMYDRKNELVVKVELPGIRKEDIDLSITEDTLTLKGETRKEEEVREEDYYAREINYGSFARTVTLPAGVQNEKAKAVFNNGILEIVLPKKEEAKQKEVKIEVT